MTFLRPFLFIFLFFFLTSEVQGTEKMIIAESGAEQQLGGHNLPSVALAAATGVEFIEIQVVMTDDHHLIVFRDMILDKLTDVAEIFPDRKREDGSYYAIDFTLREIRQLRLIHPEDKSAFPLTLSIPSLREELALIRHLEATLDRRIGMTIEIRQPWFHTDADKDISSATLNTLLDFGYTDTTAKLSLQCFDPGELQRIKNELMPERKMRLPLIQLVGENDGKETRQKILGEWQPYNYDWVFTNIGLRMLATYANAIGLPTSAVVDGEGNQLRPGYLQDIRNYGMTILVFPVNKRPEDWPAFADDFSTLLDIYLYRIKVDGLYTDSAGEVMRYLELRDEEERKKESGSPAVFLHTGARPTGSR